MKKFFAIFGVLFATTAVAGEEVVIVERMSCADMSARISEIEQIATPTEEETTEQNQLKASYRKNCVKVARGRRTSGGAHVIKQTVMVEESLTEEAAVADEEETQKEVEVAQESVPTEPDITPEQELENLDAGLCADGSKPNRFGCCGEEVFKDLGDSIFACCPKEGDGMCFPPIE
ncbi:MAG: hypothetical protein R8N50_00160 [Alphaproteobacteria bacterium]|nr:hypothetical protein [Alphaproteobacteria bacterium]